MNDVKNLSFINGVIAGAGAVVAIASAVLLTSYRSLEGILGFTTIEIRIGLFLGAIVCVIAIAYELQQRKIKSKSESVNE